MGENNKKQLTEPKSEYSLIPTFFVEVHAKSPEHLLEMHELPEIAKVLTRFAIVFMLFVLIFLIAIPWRQTSSGSGKVMAYLPQDRVQNIHATVSGRINKWFVKE